MPFSVFSIFFSICRSREPYVGYDLVVKPHVRLLVAFYEDRAFSLFLPTANEHKRQSRAEIPGATPLSRDSVAARAQGVKLL